MTGSPVALDTNRAIAVLNGTVEAARLVSRFSGLCLPVPAMGELLYGAIKSAKPRENVAVAEGPARRCRILPVDAVTARVYGEVRAALKHAGRPIPENDVWIAAICLQHDLPLATDDAHFAHVVGLTLVPTEQ